MDREMSSYLQYFNAENITFLLIGICLGVMIGELIDRNPRIKAYLKGFEDGYRKASNKSC